VQRHENLAVLRTFSKWAGLAGLRVGYGLLPPWLAEQLWKIKQPYNVSVAGQEAAIASLEDRATLLASVARIVAERERLLPRLAELPWLRPLPSAANFILCRVEGRDARTVKLELEREGILVRYYSSALLRDYIRISVGTPEQSAALLDALSRQV
jgi:histidinol-phosphate aminotransferase